MSDIERLERVTRQYELETQRIREDRLQVQKASAQAATRFAETRQRLQQQSQELAGSVNSSMQSTSNRRSDGRIDSGVNAREIPGGSLNDLFRCRQLIEQRHDSLKEIGSKLQELRGEKSQLDGELQRLVITERKTNDRVDKLCQRFRAAVNERQLKIVDRNDEQLIALVASSRLLKGRTEKAGMAGPVALEHSNEPLQSRISEQTSTSLKASATQRPGGVSGGSALAVVALTKKAASFKDMSGLELVEAARESSSHQESREISPESWSGKFNLLVPDLNPEAPSTSADTSTLESVVEVEREQQSSELIESASGSLTALDASSLPNTQLALQLGLANGQAGSQGNSRWQEATVRSDQSSATPYSTRSGFSDRELEEMRVSLEQGGAALAIEIDNATFKGAMELTQDAAGGVHLLLRSAGRYRSLTGERLRAALLERGISPASIRLVEGR